ncbi:MAG: hypothetical protein ABFS12_14410 [Bacteroidota bacterium]
MSGIQMILTIAAMLFLAMVIIMVNANILTTEEVLYDSNFGILATSIGSSIIEEANKKYYDDLTDTVVASKTSELVTPANLGIEAGEDPNDYDTWDDFDDFNGYTFVDSSMPSAIFDVECEVVYVDTTNLNVASSSQEWSKKLTVKVYSESMTDTIVQTTIYSYWWFL